MSINVEKLSPEDRVRLLNELASDQSTREAVGMKYAPRQRVAISEKYNLLFNDANQNGALGKNGNGSFYYMANVRGKGNYRSMPFPCVVSADAKGVTIQVVFPWKSQYEIDLYNGWLSGQAKPTIVSKAYGQAPPTQTMPVVQTAPVTQTPVTTPSPNPLLAKLKAKKEPTTTLTDEQSKVLPKLLEAGAYKDESDAMAHFNEWESLTTKDF